MKRILFLSLACLVLAGCDKPSIYSENTNNRDITIELLFQKDGCNVYRFEDGRSRYFVTCPYGQTMTTQSCGKNCSYQETIQTN